eukprot:9615024-Lingulodinium_polyedra.AAC.1
MGPPPPGSGAQTRRPPRRSRTQSRFGKCEGGPKGRRRGAPTGAHAPLARRVDPALGLPGGGATRVELRAR